MLQSGATVIIWCYHVMLSSGMITPSFLFFLKTSLTHQGLLCRKERGQEASLHSAQTETKRKKNM
jgi:hypothetical protein